MLKKYDAYDNVKRIVVTENGAAFTDHFVEGNIQDKQRVNFLEDYINQLLLTKKEGVAVDGYFVWTFLDNFEWAEGYFPRFGLVHVDFKTQKRTIKESGYWIVSLYLMKKFRIVIKIFKLILRFYIRG